MAEHLAEARRELAALPDAPARLRRIAEHHLRVLGGNRDLAVVFQVELRQSTKFMERFTASWLQDYFAAGRGVIEAGPAEGSLRADLPRKLVTKAFFGALDEMVTSWILGGKDYDLRPAGRPRRGPVPARAPQSPRKAAARAGRFAAVAARRGGK